MSVRKLFLVMTATVLVLALGAGAALAADPIKIARVVGITGPLEAYTKQSLVGFEMGLEYATKGTNEILGRPVELVIKDTQLKPDLGKQLLTEAFKDDGCDLAVGGVSSAVALAMLPVAEEFKKSCWSNRPWPTPLPARNGTATYSAPAAILPRTPFPTPWPWPRTRRFHRHPGAGLCLWPGRRGRLQGSRGKEWGQNCA